MSMSGLEVSSAACALVSAANPKIVRLLAMEAAAGDLAATATHSSSQSSRPATFVKSSSSCLLSSFAPVSVKSTSTVLLLLTFPTEYFLFPAFFKLHSMLPSTISSSLILTSLASTLSNVLKKVSSVTTLS
eukprot:TRINITY_DN1650_c0_g1_i27.p2 TRINITY_DN1650_c0_g1~~TRINITY_DN1650_c0_g1_i27.p2  ORF type:complete len:131 (+),score=10.71 TRINITY_DN1650_c0_g1_i27:211-603(+)